MEKVTESACEEYRKAIDLKIIGGHEIQSSCNL